MLGPYPAARRPALGQTACRFIAALSVLVTVGSAGCQTQPEKSNILLITVDTLRADRLNPYGYDKIATPAVERLADQGIVFENAFADTPWTLPSLSSVMTGKYPTEHRVRTWQQTLGTEQETLAEVLKQRGYVTAAIVGSYPLDRRFGLDQGFDHYDDERTKALVEIEEPRDTPTAAALEAPEDEPEVPDAKRRIEAQKRNAYRSDQEVAERAIEWLESNQSEPFFLWVHFFGPHEKGNRVGLSPAERREQNARWIARYDADVEEMDRQLGRLLDAIGDDPRETRTAVIFHSDHGQSLKEHGFFGHGFELFDTNVHVPLILRLPHRARAGERVGHLVRNLDIFATVLNLTGASVPHTTSADLLANRPPAQKGVYMETYHPLGLTARKVRVGGEKRSVGRILRGVRTENEKLIVNQPALALHEDGDAPLPDDYVESHSNVQLYDLAKDPGEITNLEGTREARAAQLRDQLATFRDEPDRGARQGTELDENARERLRNLGYQP